MLLETTMAIIKEINSGVLRQICVVNFNAPNLPVSQADDIVAIFDVIKKHPEHAKNVYYIRLKNINLQDLVLDFSCFSNLQEANIEECKLTKLPIFNNSKLARLSLKNNMLEQLPNIDSMPNLRILDMQYNKLSTTNINAAKARCIANGRGLKIIIDNVVKKIKDTPTSIENNFTAASCPSLSGLINEFSNSVDRPKKDIDVIARDFEYISTIARTFRDQLTKLQDANAGAFTTLMQECRQDSLLQSKFAFIIEFIRGYYPNKEINDYYGKQSRSYDEENVPEHYTSNNVWLPDFSFLSTIDSLQMPAGKERASVTSSFMFPKGMALHMLLKYWQEDITSGGSLQASYLSKSEKKQLKLRLIDPTNKPFVLCRQIDSIQKHTHTPADKYLYAMSMHGGLLASSEDRCEDEFNITKHSAFRAGQYLACAGYLEINNEGQIISISSNSGHMTPPILNLYCSAAYLYSKRTISGECIIVPFDLEFKEKPKITVSELLANLDTYVPHENIRQFINKLIQDMDKPSLIKRKDPPIIRRKPFDF